MAANILFLFFGAPIVLKNKILILKKTNFGKKHLMIMENQKFNKIICIGEVLWDMFPSGPKPGGAPLNVAVHLKKQGLNPLLISRIGNDNEGEELLDFLNGSDLSIKYIQKDKNLPTGKVMVYHDENKDAKFDICEPAAWDNIELTNELLNELKETDLIVYGSLASRKAKTLNTLIEMLESTEAERLLDVNLREPYVNQELVEKLLHLSDFVKLNNDELDTIALWHGKTGKITKLIQWMAEQYQLSDVCVTRGQKGAYLYSANIFYSHPGFKVNIVDTVGAGDAFLASLIASLSRFLSPEKSLEYACATGAFVTIQTGVVPVYSNHQIEVILNRD